ncbi:hypothetical protein V3C99_003995 [Haemonchus contortus]
MRLQSVSITLKTQQKCFLSSEVQLEVEDSVPSTGSVFPVTCSAFRAQRSTLYSGSVLMVIFLASLYYLISMYRLFSVEQIDKELLHGKQ